MYFQIDSALRKNRIHHFVLANVSTIGDNYNKPDTFYICTKVSTDLGNPIPIFIFDTSINVARTYIELSKTLTLISSYCLRI